MKKATPTPKEIAKRRLSQHPVMKIERHEQNNITNKENMAPEIKLNNKKHHRKDMDIDHFNLRNPFIVRRTIRTFFNSKKRKIPPPEPFIMADVRTVCDIDNSFYKIIEGRPLRCRDDIKVRMSNIRDILLFKANAAYLFDQALNMDASLAFEMAEYSKIDNLFIQCKNEFVKFAKTSYNTANELQNKANKLALTLYDKSEELDALSFRFVKLTNRVTDLSVTYDTLSIYRDFLDKLAPLWLTPENISAENFAKDTKSSILSAQDSLLSGGSADLDKIHKAYLKEVDSNPYFKDPKQLLDVLEDKRIQSLHYMQLGVYSAKILTAIRKCIKVLEIRMRDIIKESTDYLDIYAERIKELEDKAKTYSAIFYKILFGEFRQLYASYNATKLRTCVQYVHTKIFGVMEDPKDKISTLMYDIEGLYFQISLELDYLDIKVVEEAQMQVFAEDREIMNKAYRAQRILKEGEILRRSLYASFEPPRRRQ